MQTPRRSFFLMSAIILVGTSLVQAESSDFLTAVGTIEKLDKEILRISTGDKSKKTVELKITGTSAFHILSPQVRSGKTIITQRSAETTDLVAGEAIAVIYTLADNEHVLLTAVIKPLDKDKK